jgi:hypothetical protein
MVNFSDKWDKKESKKDTKLAKWTMKVVTKINNILYPKRIRKFLKDRKVVRKIQRFVQKHIVILSIREWYFVQIVAYANAWFFAPYLLEHFQIFMVPHMLRPDVTVSALQFPINIATVIVCLFLAFSIDDDSDDEDDDDDAPEDDGGIRITANNEDEKK